MPLAEINDHASLQTALERAREELLGQRGANGHWTGELSSSALSTATAVTALTLVQRAVPSAGHGAAIASGLRWLARHQNADGGWGDTIRSVSNISTTTLGWAALGGLNGDESDASHGEAVRHAEQWLSEKAGGIEPARLAGAIVARYGTDRTFSVPILTMCALMGRLGSGRDAWQHVIPLPFELAALPHQLFAALRLPVVSYALPALIAMGQVRHRQAPSRNPLLRFLRTLTQERTLRVLTTLQPENGGFLEATPLTSFVTMSLAGCGLADHVVTRRGVDFLRTAQRSDGSWPIDTNLATWVTTLAVNALGADALPPGPEARAALRTWLLGQQYRVEHPYTHAAPGGWAWTDLPGGVPDADDTAGALLALHLLSPAHGKGGDAATQDAVQAAIVWLLNLQNRDGGIPTFCRGWGALPFDRSSPDITAHTIHAWLAWQSLLAEPIRTRLASAVPRALAFLRKTQRSDGSWIPLWFGNQFAPDDENPVYGTSRVLSALAIAAKDPSPTSSTTPAMAAAIEWLVAAQNPDGGWGGARGIVSSVEETGLAVEALAHAVGFRSSAADAAHRRGGEWLIRKVADGTWTAPAPIGFYFAKLWYYERLYPLIFTVGALRQSLALGSRAD